MDLKITKRNSHFFYYYSKPIQFLLLLSVIFSCSQSQDTREDVAGENKPETVVKRRDDGTISSVNQVNDNNRVHGIRATYYEDGKTLYSKQTFNHGRKQGPATWYYTNGQVFKQTNFEEGKRHGLTRIYYKDGKLSGEFESEYGNVLPGLKEYNEDGTLVTSYPDVKFRELDFLASKNRLDLEIYCSKKRSGVKFYILDEKDGETSRVYLITEHDSALLQFYVKSGEVLKREVNILAEIPTELGNVLAKKYSYQLSISN
jgi:antitoxin component YwqK of YwqJK toxin-antitoxin module